MFSNTVDPTRESRMEAVVEVLVRGDRAPVRVIDLGCGPGPLTERVLRRFPSCTVLAVDTDPVLLSIGERALGRYRKRIKWILGDLTTPGWASGLGSGPYDAVVSSLALHWFYRTELRGIYRKSRTLLRPGGVLVNGDYLPAARPPGRREQPPRPSGVPQAESRVVARVDEFKQRWARWWADVLAEPGLQAAVRERALRLPGSLPPRRTTGPKTPASVAWHREALREAGFRAVSVPWRERDFRVVVGVR